MAKRSRMRNHLGIALGAATLLGTASAAAATPTVFSIDLSPGSALGSSPRGILPNTGPNAFFVSNNPAGSGVWKTDGTTAGTSRVATVDSGNVSLISGPPLSGNLAVFAPFYTPAQDVLYVTDGTAAGTTPFAVPARPANTYSLTWRSIGALGNFAFFSRTPTRPSRTSAPRP